MSPVQTGELNAAHLSVAIVAARFNDFIVTSLLRGAVEAWESHGGTADRLVIARVPGAFELPVAARQCAASGRFAAVIAFGCVIRGDTAHFDFVAGECARGLARVALDTGVPVMFGVLTVETAEQAIQRAAVRAGNKGGEAMLGAIEMANLLPRLA
ncbi:MAG: 6,7-dimethyl-8-ribityllumazine synthase [Steroidobacteraceae bacterium]|jgi:6,7-dimethyl-8-ribityllumazine synthase|nr:6,7-dimethyl-8-ribityllumazine synthase [Steroidobacteraceae bacterium]